MKKYIQIIVIEKRRAVVYAELPDGKNKSDIQEILSNSGIDWYHFEKDSETMILDTIVKSFVPKAEIPYLTEWNRLHETEGE